MLELSNPSSLASQICEEFGIPKLNLGMVTRPDGSSIDANFVTEPQLYFVLMRSRAENARPFRQWVVNDVLPSIRKTGAYTTIDVHQSNGILVTTSRNVAQVFDKRHADVLRDIDNLISQLPNEQSADLRSGLNKPFSQNSNLTSGLFISSVYKTEPNGRDYPEYLITKDGLTLLVMGYTGEKAMAFKLAYIKRFNEMEQALNSQAERANGDQVQQLMSRAQFLLSIVGIEGNQMALALDKVHKTKTGESLLALAGVELVRPQQVHLATPTEIGQRLAAARGVEKISGIAVNQMLAAKGYQERVNKKWVATEAGIKAGATYLDVGKAHSKGTPVTQLKWPLDLFSAKRYLADR